MGLWQNLKVFMGFEDDGDFPNFEDHIESFEPAKEKVAPVVVKPKPETQMRTKKASLIDFQAVQQKKISRPLADTSAFGTELIITEPRTYEDSVLLSSYLKEGKPIIVNLKHLDADAGKRLVDFVCGTVYAFEGHMQKLGGHIFLFTPKNIGITTRQNEEFEFNRGMDHSPQYGQKETVQESMFYQTAAIG